MKPLADTWRSRLHWRLLTAYYQRLRRRAFHFKTDNNIATVRFGSEYGGWTIAPAALSPESIIYSFGVGEDLSFDQALITAHGVSIHGFDPTPRARQWLKEQALPKKYCFHAYGLADFDGEAAFLPPKEKGHASYTMLASPRAHAAKASGKFVTAPVRRLSTIMKVLGHTRIDLLKMDIEGAEYAVINDILRGDLRPRQWLVEFHHQGGAKLYQTWLAVRSLRRCGWQLFQVSKTGYEFSFLDRRARGGNLP